MNTAAIPLQVIFYLQGRLTILVNHQTGEQKVQIKEND
jgi:hypothetical protein